MAGMNLNMGIRGSASYTPMTPASASSPSARSSISEMAYGINGSGADDERKVAGYGTVGVGIASLAALVFIWYSLPR